MKIFLHVLTAIAFNFLVGATFGAFVGFDPVLSGIGANAIGMIPFQSMTGVSLYAGVLQEVWTGELVKQFRHEMSFLTTIQSRDNLVNNDVIHLVDVGADPDVLINNTTYPIAIVSRPDEDIAISLDKFDTENTRITDDELYAITYDKIGSVVEQHNEVLEEKTLEKALHSIAPASNATGTPVIRTTGATSDGKKRATVADFIKMKRHFDDLKVPKRDRHVVLSNRHVEDLLNTNEAFAKQYMEIREGQVLKLHGWNIHELAYSPVYNHSTVVKKAFGAASEGSDQDASIFYYAPRVFKARGSVKFYYKDASENPEFRESVAGFRLRFIALPKKQIGFGALVTDNA